MSKKLTNKQIGTRTVGSPLTNNEQGEVQLERGEDETSPSSPTLKSA